MQLDPVPGGAVGSLVGHGFLAEISTLPADESHSTRLSAPVYVYVCVCVCACLVDDESGSMESLTLYTQSKTSQYQHTHTGET